MNDIVIVQRIPDHIITISITSLKINQNEKANKKVKSQQKDDFKS